MRVLIINTSETTGGAAVAASRLTDALNNNGIKASMLVRDKQTDRITTISLPRKMLNRYCFLRERWSVFRHLHFSRRHLFDIDIANTGADITRTAAFRNADIIHLHWVNQGMLSLKTIKKILESGKPVVWTMHDMWPATAICHLTLGCRQYQTMCSHCQYLPGKGGKHDLSYRTWQHKADIYRQHRIHFVACSKWLEGEARKSMLLNNQPITSIPNPIDTRQYCKTDKTAARQRLRLPADKHLLLFGAQRVTNKNKGISYLIEACKILKDHHPQLAKRLAIVMIGSNGEEIAPLFPLDTYSLGYVSDAERLVDVYNAADIYVLPSLSENLPNAIMESMACGTPCIGFNVGGIPEEITHLRTGYLADYKSAGSLAEGIRWILSEADYGLLSRQAMAHVAANYSQSRVASQYIALYQEALKTAEH